MSDDLRAVIMVIEATIPGYRSDAEAIARALRAHGLLAEHPATPAADPDGGRAYRTALYDEAGDGDV